MRQTEGKTRSGECRGSQENQEGQFWGVQGADWYETVCTQGGNVCVHIEGCIRAQNSRFEKGEEK